VGFFSAEVRGDGSIATWHGWDGAAGAGLVADAHGHGKKAVLVVTCFDQATIHAVLTSGRAAAIANLVAGVEAAGGDGVNLDFEGLDDLDRDAMVTFTTDLAAALRAAVPGAHLSLATPAVDWSMAWDYAGLADAADQLMIMAYDYHWRGSDPGPVAPLTLFLVGLAGASFGLVVFDLAWQRRFRGVRRRLVDRVALKGTR